jgi:flagellar protein FlbT
MPLKLSLRPNEKVIINGVVLENIDDNATILVHNQGQLLRSKDILTFEQATTPALRAYYAVQCLYLFPEKRELYWDSARQFLEDFAEAAPSTREIVDEIMRNLGENKVYQGLKLVKRLIEHEKRLFTDVA